MAVNQTKGETPSLSELIRVGIEGRLFDLNTAMPGKVVAYHSTKGMVDVQPVFKRKYTKNNKVTNLPVINNVPVCFPRSGVAAITFPIQPGDYVMLVFSQRSMDKWKTFGGVISPGDPRTHHLSDAVAFPGVYPQVGIPVPFDPDNLVVRHALSKIVLKKTGDITIQGALATITMTKAGQFKIGNGAVELLTLIDNLLDQVMALTVNTVVGVSTPPNNLAAIALIKTQLALIKG